MLSSPTLLVVGYILKLLPASALFAWPVKDFQVEIKCRSTFARDACCLLFVAAVLTFSMTVASEDCVSWMVCVSVRMRVYAN